ncbi:phosphoribulokinase uridine kinase family protein [Purpureocillium lavendulum]|uniref:Phosphoribulokinase uridine kinase family protein n=1 Tax=Purpureocillium lavendulum TaxID=1247861 RepID=A0AB34FL15_9HYPO|nr:phosphoribulokinase uridine kinase family protein [Purpureocillium lavendulum]
MDATYNALADRVRRKWAEAQARGQRRLIIAVAGPPGSGKTTIARHVVDLVSHAPSGPSIVAVSADGFHLPLSTLRTLPNAAEALARRGAPWTFDGRAAAELVLRLRDRAGRGPVSAPTFDHAVKDPIEDGITVASDVDVCVFEGNYLLCDEGPWSAIADAVDDRWLVRVDSDLARRRVAARHLKAGIESTMADALKRAQVNDMVNGEYVMRHSFGRYDVLVESIEQYNGDP